MKVNAPLPFTPRRNHSYIMKALEVIKPFSSKYNVSRWKRSMVVAQALLVDEPIRADTDIQEKGPLK